MSVGHVLVQCLTLIDGNEGAMLILNEAGCSQRRLGHRLMGHDGSAVVSAAWVLERMSSSVHGQTHVFTTSYLISAVSSGDGPHRT